MSRLTAALIGLAVVTSGMVVTASVASASLPCGSLSLYGTTSGLSPNRIVQFSATTGALQGNVVSPAAANGDSINQLGISPGGTYVYYTDTSTEEVVEYNTDTGVEKVTPAIFGSNNPVMGAVNPVNGIFYYAGFLSSTQVWVTAYNRATTTSSAVATINISSPGVNGDLVFDGAGNLYVVSSSTSTLSGLVRVNGTLPITGPAVTLGSTTINDSVQTGAFGAAFGADGYLYLQNNGASGSTPTLSKVDPSNGNLVGAQVKLPVPMVDLGSCANPNTLSSQVSLPNGRANPGDQLTVTISGDGLDVGNTATTTGTQTSATAGPVFAVPNTNYTVALSGTGSANLNAYDVTYSCTDAAHGDVVVTSGTGPSATFQVNTTGALVSCAFATAAKTGPTLNPDTATTTQGVPVAINPLANDVAGDGALDPTTVRLVNSAGTAVTSLSTAQGTYTVNTTTGIVTFAPAASFTGVAPAVTYQETDKNGITRTSTITVTVAKGPTANPDTATTGQGKNVTVNVLANDVAGTAPLDPTTVKLIDAGGNPVTTLTTAAGTYTVDPTTGAVTFAPAATFTGVAPAVNYQVADKNGLTAKSTVTITVFKGPTANPDTATTAGPGKSVTVNPLANDVAGDAPLNPTTVALVDGTGALVTTLTNAAGTYTVNAVTGAVTFTPVAGFTGVAPAVTYQVSDTNGQTARSTVTVTVPKGPTANPDTATTKQNTSVTTDVLANDVAGDAALDPTSVKLVGPLGVLTTTLATTQGVYTVNPTTGAITFAPLTSFTGAATPVTYQVADKNGLTAQATLAVTVTPAKGPTANPDTFTVGAGLTTTIDPLANDVAGDAALDPSTIKLIGPLGVPTLVLPTVAGTFTANPLTGKVVFVPSPLALGPVPTVTYQITDKNGLSSQSTISVLVAKGPTINPDTLTTGVGVTAMIDPLANDVAGDAALDPTSVKLLDGTGNPVTSLTTAAGAYTVDPTTGKITFAPAAGFKGTAPAVTVRVADKNGLTGQAALNVKVATGPTINPDSLTAAVGATATIDPLANDVAGDAPLDPTSVKLINGAGNPVTSLTTAAGAYTVDPTTGKITFAPAAGFKGTAPAVTVRVADKNGLTGQAALNVVVATGPTINPDSLTTGIGVTATIDPLANDVAGDTPLDPTSVKLINGAGNPVTTLTTAAGAYTVDPTTGRITFAPAAGFKGTAPAVTVRVADKNGLTGQAALNVLVAAGPTINPDNVVTAVGAPVTFDPLANDVAGDAPLDPTSVKLIDGTGAPVTTLTLPAGTFAVDPATGKITFTPNAGFKGTVPPVTVRVADKNGLTGQAAVNLLVATGPTINPDTLTTAVGVTATIDPLANDVAGDAPLEPASVKLIDGTGKPVTSLTLPAGVFTVDPTTGKITFAPAAGFKGTVPPVTVRVADKNGLTGQSTLGVTVATGPTINPDSLTTGIGVTATIDPLANDVPGDAPLDPTTVTLIDGTGKPVSTLTTAAGTYTVDPTTGKITFAPASAFKGTAPPVTVRVADKNGLTGQAALNVLVAAGPTINPDNVVTPVGAPVTFDPLANDVAGDAPLDPTSVKLIDGTGALVTTLTTPAGKFDVDPVTGKVTFTPNAGFKGTVPPVTVQVADKNGLTGQAPVNVLVATGPTINPDTVTTAIGAPITFDPLANDVAGDAPLDPTSVKLIDGTGALVTTLTTPAGKFDVDPVTGKVTFTPNAGFSGTVPSVTLQVGDKNGLTGRAPITVTVAKAPTINADNVVTPVGVPVTFDPLANDVAGDAPLDPTSVKLIDGTGAPVTTLTTPAGKFDVDPVTGKVTFTPDAGFKGTVPPVTVQVADKNGLTGQAPVNVLVATAPTINADNVTTAIGAPVTFDPLANDVAGDAPLDPTSVKLIDGTGAPVTTLTTAAGKFDVDPATGKITFTPDAGFKGTVPPVTVQVADKNGLTGQAPVNVLVATAPTINADNVTTAIGAPVTFDPLANDVAGDAPLDPTSVKLIDGTGAPVTTLTTPAGKFDVDPVTGKITFTPDAGFKGTVPPVTVQVADKNGLTGQAPVNVLVATAPTINADNVVTPVGAPVTFDPLVNDVAGDAPLDPTSVKLIDGTGQPVTTLTTPAGKFDVDPVTGKVTFTPDAGFKGTVPPVTVQVGDKNGLTGQAPVNVLVATAPTINADTVVTAIGAPVTFDPLANDVAGDAPLDPTSVKLIDGTGAPVTTLTTAAGKFDVDPVTGKITFTPDAGFKGTVPPVTVQVADKNGLTGQAPVNVLVATAPTINADNVVTPVGAPVTFDPLANDVAGDAPLDPTSVKLIDGTGAPVTTLTTPAGKFDVDPVTGKITFTPVAGFKGTVPPVTVQVADKNGLTGQAPVNVLVATAPTINADNVVTPVGAPVTFDPLANDVAGDAPLDPTSVKLIDGTGAPVTTLTTPAGTFAVDPVTGKITFTPVAGFKGTVPPVTVQVADKNGLSGQAPVNVLVATAPTINADTVVTAVGAPITFDPLANDVAGDAPLDPTSVKLIDGTGAPVTTLTLPAGKFDVDPVTGKITFTPDAGFKGTVPPVTVQVADKNGLTGQAPVNVLVATAPTINADTVVTPVGAPVTFDPLANDVAGDAPLDPTSVKLIDGTGAPVTTLTTPAGTFAVDPVTGKITFTPVAGFKGTVPPVTVRVADKNGLTGQAPVNVLVANGPTVNPDTLSTTPGVAATIDPLANDVVGDAPLDPTSVKLIDGTGAPVTTVTTAAGTYTVDPTTGKITFAPDPTFIGTAAPVTYQVADQNGLTGKADLTATVAPVGPTVNPDTVTTDQGVPVTIDPLANDVAGTAPLDPTSVKLLDGTGQPVTTLTAAEGTYTVDPTTGKITFAPDLAFTGPAAPVTYRVADTGGSTGQSTITATVSATPGKVPVFNPDTLTVAPGETATLNPLANDVPGDAPFDPTSVRLLDENGNAVTTLTTAAGTDTVNPATGDVTLVSNPSFVGKVKLRYRAMDTKLRTGGSDFTNEVVAPAGPTVNPDTVTTNQGVPGTVDPLANDVAGAAPLDPTSVKLLDGTGNPVTKLTTAEGTYTVDPTTGKITFAPVLAFTGPAAPVTYRVADTDGRNGQSTLTATVTATPGKIPVFNPDTLTVAPGQTATLNPLANDVPGDAPFNPASLRLLDENGNAVTTLTTPAGTDTVDPATGAITLVSNPSFVGKVTRRYVVSDTSRRTGGSDFTNNVQLTTTVPPTTTTAPPTTVPPTTTEVPPTTTTAPPTTTPPTTVPPTTTTKAPAGAPVANPDTATTDRGVPVEVDVLANDVAGAAPLDPTTVRLVDRKGDLVQKLVTPQGRYTVDPETGKVTFAPNPRFQGVAPAVTYQVADTSGQTAQSTITVTVGEPTTTTTQPPTTTPTVTPTTSPKPCPCDGDHGHHDGDHHAPDTHGPKDHNGNGNGNGNGNNGGNDNGGNEPGNHEPSPANQPQTTDQNQPPVTHTAHPAPAAGGGNGSGGSGDTGSLPFTGAEVIGIALLGLGALTGGATLLLANRRRRRNG